MRIGGEPITAAPLKNPKSFVAPAITSAASFQDWEAAHGAGLDLYQWDTGGYPPIFMGKVKAWYRLHKLVALHSADAAIKKPRKGG